jgi:hypothetical protein
MKMTLMMMKMRTRVLGRMTTKTMGEVELVVMVETALAMLEMTIAYRRNPRRRRRGGITRAKHPVVNLIRFVTLGSALNLQFKSGK